MSTKYKSIGQRILQNAFSRIVIGLVFIYAVNMGVLAGLMKTHFFNEQITTLFANLISSIFTILAYILVYKWLEKRTITEFSLHRIGKSLLLGLTIGFVLQSLTILVIYLKGGYEVLAVNPISHILIPLGLSVSYAIGEEVLFRGVLFRIMEEKLGTYIALLVSALVFGLLHVLNPGSSLIDGFSIAVQAGLLLGVAYVYSRDLWLPIMVHFSWDFTESAIYGATLSGTTSQTLISSKIEGAKWLTGGSFGPEGSLQATIFCLIVSLILLYLAHKQGKIIQPFWAKR